jgi:hypothetical protein
MKTEELKPWADDVALRGPDAPKNDDMIEHLICYLLTVHKRFGNTCVTNNLQWGAAAMHKRDPYLERIEELSKALTAIKQAAKHPKQEDSIHGARYRCTQCGHAWLVAEQEHHGDDCIYVMVRSLVVQL